MGDGYFCISFEPTHGNIDTPIRIRSRYKARHASTCTHQTCKHMYTSLRTRWCSQGSRCRQWWFIVVTPCHAACMYSRREEMELLSWRSVASQSWGRLGFLGLCCAFVIAPAAAPWVWVRGCVLWPSWRSVGIQFWGRLGCLGFCCAFVHAPAATPWVWVWGCVL